MRYQNCDFLIQLHEEKITTLCVVPRVCYGFSTHSRVVTHRGLLTTRKLNWLFDHSFAHLNPASCGTCMCSIPRLYLTDRCRIHGRQPEELLDSQFILIDGGGSILTTLRLMEECMKDGWTLSYARQEMFDIWDSKSFPQKSSDFRLGLIGHENDQYTPEREENNDPEWFRANSVFGSRLGQGFSDYTDFL